MTQERSTAALATVASAIFAAGIVCLVYLSTGQVLHRYATLVLVTSVLCLSFGLVLFAVLFASEVSAFWRAFRLKARARKKFTGRTKGPYVATNRVESPTVLLMYKSSDRHSLWGVSCIITDPLGARHEGRDGLQWGAGLSNVRAFRAPNDFPNLWLPLAEGDYIVEWAEWVADPRSGDPMTSEVVAVDQFSAPTLQPNSEFPDAPLIQHVQDCTADKFRVQETPGPIPQRTTTCIRCSAKYVRDLLVAG